MYAEVAIDPLPRLFHYRLPDSMESALLQLGSRLLVPFGTRVEIAYFVRWIDRTDIQGIKDVLAILDTTSPLPPPLIKLLQWISDYYLAPIGAVMKTAFPLKSQYKVVRKVQITEAGNEKCWKVTPPKQAKQRLSQPELQALSPPLPLNPDQKKAYIEIVAAIEKSGFFSFLLHGVTGSGKTEVYLQVIQKALERNKRAIVLVPEIGLTPQLVARFRNRFGNQIAVLHSRLTPKERYEAWRKIKEKEVNIAIGARSALFAPMESVGVIIVDEEQDPSYKQDKSIRYHARDAAIVYAQLSGAVVVLGSATPSLESFYNGTIGKYKTLTLPHRVEDRTMPAIEIIDLREREAWVKPFLTRTLLSAIEKRLGLGEQVILFINRRGHTPSLLCGDCGQKWLCGNCSVSLTFHKREKKLICHYCGFQQSAPTDCVNCQGTRLLFLGVGTEQVEEEIKALFPSARVLRMDRDTTSKKGAHYKIVAAMEEKEADILIGTQMVAKGHDFPGVTLAGIICADFALNFPDFRSSERTFQLLAQVAGRTGRGKRPGEVLIQTFQPEHELFRVIPHFEPFYHTERGYRKDANYPPFTRLILIGLCHKNKDTAENQAERLAAILKQCSNGIEVLGPAPAPLTRLRNEYRYQILLKGLDRNFLKSALKKGLDAFWAIKNGQRAMRTAHLTIDVDPQNLI
ncbi:MAG: primosomal protein N' [Nitrospirae bacterium]|nr:primosomal protein N' [Candidatus Troglogloeales bacterium]